MRGAVTSIDHQRAQRGNQRLERMQAEFARRGFALDVLTGDKLLVQRWGLYRVLDDLDQAQRYLDEVGGAR